ncbi:MAG: thioredoxin domain-containing protein [Candidatus Eisenbacteria bacterium]
MQYLSAEAITAAERRGRARPRRFRNPGARATRSGTSGPVLILLAVAMAFLWSGCSTERGDETVVTEDKTGVHVNRLINEASPYLLQHAHNPVDWYPWGEEALARARHETKPIFLSIGYSACHWCHVMELESFENDEIAGILNREFVSIKVDREERPDLDEIYMNSVQLMTGSGGWPLSVFLTPDLKPFFGGTYFPPEDRLGLPGFKSVLMQVAAVWMERRGDVLNSAEQITQVLRTRRQMSSGDGEIDKDILSETVKQLTYSFDQKFGGFGDAPKFPPSGAIGLLLRRYLQTRDENLLRMATLTLDKMAGGGMYDQIGGGFHRYSVDRTWLVPHFEKMLYDNALLSVTYLEAYQLTGKPLYRRIAAETLDYVIRVMSAPSGGFHSTQDADSEGEEGKYYVWGAGEIADILGPADATLFSAYYDVTDEGNFEGKTILNVPVTAGEFAGTHDMTEEDLLVRFAPLRKRLLQARAGRVPPAMDDKVIASWNGMMISALARGYQVLGEKRFRTAAEGAGDFILASMMENGEIFHTYRAGHARIPGYLDDYAHIANAMVDLYETTFDVRWIEASNGLVAKMIDLFRDDDQGGFYFTSSRHQHLLTRTKPYLDGSVPSGNSTAALVLLRLGRLTGNNAYLTRAEQVLRAAMPMLKAHPTALTHMLGAMDSYLSPVKEIAIAGRIDEPETRQMLATVRSGFLPNKVVAFIDPDDAGAQQAREHIPLLAGRSVLYNTATAYVCENQACDRPLNDPDELARKLNLDTRVDQGGSDE